MINTVTHSWVTKNEFWKGGGWVGGWPLFKRIYDFHSVSFKHYIHFCFQDKFTCIFPFGMIHNEVVKFYISAYIMEGYSHQRAATAGKCMQWVLVLNHATPLLSVFMTTRARGHTQAKAKAKRSCLVTSMNGDPSDKVTVNGWKLHNRQWDAWINLYLFSCHSWSDHSKLAMLICCSALTGMDSWLIYRSACSRLVASTTYYLNIWWKERSNSSWT